MNRVSAGHRVASLAHSDGGSPGVARGLGRMASRLAALLRMPAARSPPALPAFEIEADWQLLNTCNYRCGYCFFSPELLGEKLRPSATPAQWQQAFDATGLRWLLHLTGGEPSLYPSFAELCERLSERHTLSMNSNLTNPALVAFAARVDPARIAFINAGLHDAERQSRDGFTIFLRHAGLLLERGYPLFASVVATPSVLAHPDVVIERLRPIGLAPFPKLLQGSWEGRMFPDGYTADERAAFRHLAQAARAANGARMAGWAVRPTIDVESDDMFLDGLPRFTGRSCEAGRRFVRLHGDGSVYRCSTKTALGNLLDGSFVRREGPAPCDTSYCFYFCRKYASSTSLAAA